MIFRVLGFVAGLWVISFSTAFASGVKPEDIQIVFSAEEVDDRCKEATQQVQKRLKEIESIKLENSNFENTVIAFENALADLGTATDPVTFMGYVSTDEAARKAGSKCEEDIGKVRVDIFARSEIYERMKHVKSKSSALEETETRLLDDYIRTFKDTGLDLKPSDRKKFIEITKKIETLQVEYKNELVNWPETMTASREELEGFPDDMLNSLERVKGGKELFKLTLSYPHVYAVLDHVKVAETRRKMQYLFARRGGEKNVKRLEEAIKLRDDCAKMLGYKNHADRVLVDRMAKSSETVSKFLMSLRDKLKDRGISELKTLEVLKRSETAAKTGEKIQIKAWDVRYYDTMLKKQKYQVDQEAIKVYFPLDVVTNGMFKIYQTILGVRFEDVTSKIKLWHADVKAYEIFDSKSGSPIAYFFMDLFPRQGKYNHAAAFTLINGKILEDGSYRMPISSIVANFNPPTASAPSLLLHDQVETYFHEFGHIMHQTLTRAKYSSQAGTNVKQDFVEAPSQMLENWVWEPEPLKMMSGHYQDHKKVLPDDLIQKLIAAKKVNQGLFYLRQLMLGSIDLEYHTHGKSDTTATWARLSKEIGLVEIQEKTWPQASFGHLMGGYDAGYYGYLWSEVYAQDMAAKFKTDGWLSPKTGMAYRLDILEPGDTRDPMTLLTKFLGREPKTDAFFESLGIK